MNEDFVLDSMEYIDADLIEHAGRVSQRKHWSRIALAAAAACLCLVIGGAILFRGRQADAPEVQQWSESMQAGDYFKNSSEKKQGASSSSASLVMPPYAVEVSIDNTRGALEAEGVLPMLPEHTEHSFRVEYNGDGSLYKVEFWWMRRSEGSLDVYSDLKLTAAPKELHEVSDVVVVRLDESGNPLAPEVKATLRDGVAIYAEGSENEHKTLTWQTAQGWYQLSGSFKDSYEDVIALLDWFWAHPFDLDRFGTLPEGSIIFSSREQQPAAFLGQLPDFAALGYTAETEKVNLGLRLGEMTPVWFDGIYTRGETRVRWTVSTGADADDFAACLGRPAEVTEQKLTGALAKNGYVNLFFDLPCMATLRMENGTAADAWEIVQLIANGNR